jgi:hypothetical protein
MLLQIIDLSIDYFSYPFSIKIDMNYDKQQTLPSITLCTPRNTLFSKTQIKDNYPDIYMKILKLERDYDFCSVLKSIEQHKPKENFNKCLQNFLKFNKDLNSVLEEIRYRNTINTSLEQLFERTLHLNEWVDCKVHYKDGRVINCLEIDRLVEMFDASNFYGKCFVNFNRDYDRKIFENFSITKDDSIKFKLYLDHFNSILNNNWRDSSALFMAIHSYKNSVTVPDFFNIDTNDIRNTRNYCFSKYIYKSLEWPYNTNCDYYNHNNLYHSPENCIQYCNLYNQNLSQECLNDPLNKSSFSISHRIMNKAFRHLKVCQTSNKFSTPFKCEKLFKRHCYEDYYQYIATDGVRTSVRNSLFVQIRARNLPIYECSAIPKYSFILYMTSIGSLLSLWLGISALDLRAVVEISIEILKNITIKGVWICFMNEYFYNFGSFILKILHYLNFFKKLDLKKITIILSVICFIYQLIELTLEFTEFKTTIYVELLNGLNGLDLPAYFVCAYQLNTNSMDLLKKNLNSSDNNDSKRLKAEFPQMINGYSNIQERNISKYLVLAKNKMPSYIRCATDKEENEVCIEKNLIIMSISNLGEFYTLSPLKYPISEISKLKRDLEILRRNFMLYNFKICFQNNSENQNFQSLYHDPNEVPSLTVTDDVANVVSMIKVKRLPPPYDSNCFDYKNSKSFKSRGQCINDCIFEKILKRYGCIPRESANVLTLYDNMTLNLTFCVDNNFEDFNGDDCSDRCLKPCEEIIFRSFEIHSNEAMNYHHKRHIIYINKIYMTFIFFMSSIGGLLGLWNNVSIYDLQLIILKVFGKIFKLKLLTKLPKYFFSAKILTSFDLIRSFVVKINLKVKKCSLKIFYLSLYYYFLGIANDCNGYYSHNTNNFIHSRFSFVRKSFSDQNTKSCL